jgi:hypothetical protein
MRTENTVDPSGGPFKNMFETCCSGMDMAAQGFEPWFKAMASSGLELMSLMSRRAQAYMEIPNCIGHCRTPQDIVDEQMRFWQTAFRQYAESSQRAVSAWTNAMSLPSGFVALWAPAAKPERDLITFPEPKEAVSGTEPKKKEDERRAA